MKLAISFAIAGLLLFSLFLYQSGIWFRDKTIDIHIHDTYIVFDYWSFLLLALLILVTLFSLGGVIGTGFKNKFFLLALLMAIALNSLTYWWYFKQ